MTETVHPDRLSARGRSHVAKLVAVTLAMFGFGYALVPLYDLFCEITGLGGRTDVADPLTKLPEVDPTRSLEIQFTSTAVSDLPWDFRPMQDSIELHPGEVVTVNYEVRNRSAEDTVGRAIPSVAPPLAGQHFKKTDCFCFDFQPLAAGETKIMPVRFYVDPEISDEVRQVTLSYTFFDASDVVGASGAGS